MGAAGVRRDICWGEPGDPSTTQSCVCAIVSDVWGMLHTPVDHSWKDGQVSTQERGKKKEVFIVSYNLIPGPVSPPPA